GPPPAQYKLLLRPQAGELPDRFAAAGRCREAGGEIARPGTPYRQALVKLRTSHTCEAAGQRIGGDTADWSGAAPGSLTFCDCCVPGATGATAASGASSGA